MSAKLLRSFSDLVRALAIGALLAGQAFAFVPDEPLPDAEREARAQAIARELRCLVCQNQSIAESDAPLARDLRMLVRERIQVGDADEAVRAYIVERYGDWVLLNPPVKGKTLLLWLGPLLVLLSGLAGVALYFRRLAKKADAPAGLTPEERARLCELIGEDAQE
jgi:cytochrome c-type biogenesis protein CcmH